MGLRALLALPAMLLAAGCEAVKYGAQAPDQDYVYTRLDDEIVTPSWADRAPSAADMQRVYPQRALQEGVTGRVILLCTVEPSRKLDCMVDRDEQPGYAFGEAALSVSQIFLVKSVEPGSPTAAGQKVRVPIRFTIE